MTHRQTIFISEYLKTGNATEAAKAAGYAERTAYSTGQRLLKNVEIAKAIKAHQLKAMEQAHLSVVEVVGMIREMAVSGNVESNRLRAMDMLMRHLGAYTDELKIISSMTDTEVDELVNRLLAKMK